MKREPREFFNDHQRGDYLENPEYDLGCEWVVRNLPLVRALLASDGKVGDDGIVDYGHENQDRYHLDAIRQIGVRQDGSYYGTAGPIVGFIDVAIVERRTEESESRYNKEKWAVAVIVRPKILYIGRLLREIEFCRQGCIKDKRVEINVGGGDFIKGDDLPYVILSSSKEHQNAITGQGFIFLSCPEAFKRPSAS